MAIPPDTGPVPVITTNTRLWIAPSNPTHFAGPPAPRRTTRNNETGNTRPRLSRVLSPSTPVLAKLRPSPSVADFPALPDKAAAESHRAVLAHEISPNDTLAGVALKYGISVTELRRANQLWASDSIHLRQVLYVPWTRHGMPTLRPWLRC
ncbi:hypothetical protein BGY98DRAFT_159465 [Russula aff. rugulosa BPL654]|nr:hypothetical protein BGY98DRAFT_159465 [Russula aff. rugulosa BPL654]